METPPVRARHYGTLSNCEAREFDSGDDRGDARRAPARRVATLAARLMRSLRVSAGIALPQSCVLCTAPSGRALLCDACEAAMPRIEAGCPRCALPSPGAVVCAACVRDPPPFDAALAAWVYAWPADRLLHAFKYGGRLVLAEPLAHALAAACRAQRDTRTVRGDTAIACTPWPDCLVAVPLTPARQRARGFNQAQEIAKRVGERLGIPTEFALARLRDAAPQATLGGRDRRDSVGGSFVADRRVAGATVAIVDDVMTTGATLAAAAEALRRAGARRIEAWSVARTLAPGP